MLKEAFLLRASSTRRPCSAAAMELFTFGEAIGSISHSRKSEKDVTEGEIRGVRLMKKPSNHFHAFSCSVSDLVNMYVF